MRGLRSRRKTERGCVEVAPSAIVLVAYIILEKSRQRRRRYFYLSARVTFTSCFFLSRYIVSVIASPGLW
jgi:hypothetical protein